MSLRMHRIMAPMKTLNLSEEISQLVFIMVRALPEYLGHVKPESIQVIVEKGKQPADKAPVTSMILLRNHPRKNLLPGKTFAMIFAWPRFFDQPAEKKVSMILHNLFSIDPASPPSLRNFKEPRISIFSDKVMQRMDKATLIWFSGDSDLLSRNFSVTGDYFSGDGIR